MIENVYPGQLTDQVSSRFLRFGSHSLTSILQACPHQKHLAIGDTPFFQAPVVLSRKFAYSSEDRKAPRGELSMAANPCFFKNFFRAKRTQGHSRILTKNLITTTLEAGCTSTRTCFIITLVPVNSLNQ